MPQRERRGPTGTALPRQRTRPRTRCRCWSMKWRAMSLASAPAKPPMPKEIACAGAPQAHAHAFARRAALARPGASSNRSRRSQNAPLADAEREHGGVQRPGRAHQCRRRPAPAAPGPRRCSRRSSTCAANRCPAGCRPVAATIMPSSTPPCCTPRELAWSRPASCRRRQPANGSRIRSCALKASIETNTKTVKRRAVDSCQTCRERVEKRSLGSAGAAAASRCTPLEPPQRDQRERAGQRRHAAADRHQPCRRVGIEPAAGQPRGDREADDHHHPDDGRGRSTALGRHALGQQHQQRRATRADTQADRAGRRARPAPARRCGSSPSRPWRWPRACHPPPAPPCRRGSTACSGRCGPSRSPCAAG